MTFYVVLKKKNASDAYQDEHEKLMGTIKEMHSNVPYFSLKRKSQYP